MKTGLYLFCCLLVTFLNNGCASQKNLIVLLPDNEGHIGEVQITNGAGTGTIDKAWHVSQVENAKTAPSMAVPIKKDEVDRIFGQTLKALPEPPIRYIIYFKADTTELVPDSKKVISDVIREISTRHSRDICISGHTDSVGTDDYNMKLSYSRAVRIKDTLISMGMRPDDIEVSYYGKRNPLVKVGDGVPELRNRRVEIHVR